MGIDTLPHYNPMYQYPFYLKLIPPEHNDYKVGSKYDMRVEDGERQRDKGGSGPYRYIHEAVLIGKQEYKFEDVPNILIAVLGDSKSRSEALERITPKGTPYPDDRELVLLTFLRLDAAKDFVENDKDIIPSDMSKESVEGNGRGMATDSQG